ncbi:hypothetical protein QCA50_006511 [Cerrena zonata]|uniref:Uncharacterized protein n=1 Tax=Cerrena zonata TaxID=2478898 RepID=A0AAW0GBP7_9APHY
MSSESRTGTLELRWANLNAHDGLRAYQPYVLEVLIYWYSAKEYFMAKWSRITCVHSVLPLAGRSSMKVKPRLYNSSREDTLNDKIDWHTERAWFNTAVNEEACSTVVVG